MQKADDCIFIFRLMSDFFFFFFIIWKNVDFSSVEFQVVLSFLFPDLCFTVLECQ